MHELTWTATRDGGAVAPGNTDVYRIVADAGRVLLSRIPRAVTAVDAPAPIIYETMRNCFEVPNFGDLRAAVLRAKGLAQAYENGHPLTDVTGWLNPPFPEPAPERPRLLGPDRVRFLGVGHRHPHTEPERVTAQPWELTEEQAAEMLAQHKDQLRVPVASPEQAARVLAKFQDRYPQLTYADEGLAPGTDATAEHLAMAGPRLRAHLDAAPAAQPERGHGVPRLAEQAVAGHHGDGDPLRDLHVRRHTYNRPEDWT